MVLSMLTGVLSSAFQELDTAERPSTFGLSLWGQPICILGNGIIRPCEQQCSCDALSNMLRAAIVFCLHLVMPDWLARKQALTLCDECCS